MLKIIRNLVTQLRRATLLRSGKAGRQRRGRKSREPERRPALRSCSQPESIYRTRLRTSVFEGLMGHGDRNQSPRHTPGGVLTGEPHDELGPLRATPQEWW